jgi:hypothetical protein
VIALVATSADWVQAAWCIAAVLIYLTKTVGRRPAEVIRAVFHELRPFYWPAFCVETVAEAWLDQPFGFWQAVGIASTVFCWWFYKDIDKDDRWKRRKAKLADKVRRAGSRLVVSPAGAP